MKSNSKVNKLIEISDANTEQKKNHKPGVEGNARMKEAESKAPIDLPTGKERVGDSTKHDSVTKHSSLETQDRDIITSTAKMLRPFAMKDQSSEAETDIGYGDSAYGDNADGNTGLGSMEVSLNGPLPGMVIVAAVAATACFAFFLYILGFSGQWLYDFFYHRSFVQWVSFTLFFIGLFSLFHRLRLYRQEKKALCVIGTSINTNALRSVVYRRWQAVLAHLKLAPAHKVKEYAVHSAEDEVGDLDAGYSSIRHCIYILPMISFFGTVWGLSKGLHSVGMDLQNMTSFLSGFNIGLVPLITVIFNYLIE